MEYGIEYEYEKERELDAATPALLVPLRTISQVRNHAVRGCRSTCVRCGHDKS
jgi:hypothetical protein